MRRLFLLSLFALSACSRGTRYDSNIFSWQEAEQPGTVLRIRNVRGDVHVSPAADGKTAKVRVSARWHKGNPKRDLTFDTQSGGGVVTICAIWGEGDCDHTRPRGFLSRLLAGNTDATVDFEVEVPNGVRVELVTVDGSVDVRAQVPVVARSTNGTVKVLTGVGPVDARTVNGDVEVRMTSISGDGEVHAETTNGDVAAFVPAAIDSDAMLLTVNGSATTTLPLTPQGTDGRKWTGVLGAGGRKLVVKTVNGSAMLGALDSLGQVVTKQ